MLAQTPGVLGSDETEDNWTDESQSVDRSIDPLSGHAMAAQISSQGVL